MVTILSDDKPDEALCQALVPPNSAPLSPASEDLQDSLPSSFRATRIQVEKSVHMAILT